MGRHRRLSNRVAQESHPPVLKQDCAEAKTPWAAAALLVVAIAAAYANSFHGPFIYDDQNSVVSNPSIRHLWSTQALRAPPEALTTVGRPVANLSLAVNYAIGGLDVWGYHAVNLAIHVLAALVLFGLLRRTLLLPALAERFGRAATPLALTIALLWALHPLQTESVTYVVQRTESIFGLFYLLTLYCLVRGVGSVRSGAWHTASAAACGLGMASKEAMISAPLVALLYDSIFISGSFKEALRRRRGLYLSLAGTWAILGALVYLPIGRSAWNGPSHGVADAILAPFLIFRGGTEGSGSSVAVPVWAYARAQLCCIIHYLRLVFWPMPLVLDYGQEALSKTADIIPCAAAVGLLLAATGVGLARRRGWGFLGAWFFAILAPSSSFIPLMGEIEAEHRMYLPLAAVLCLIVLGAYAALRPLRSPVSWALVLAAAGALGWRTHQRNAAYSSVLAIWRDTVKNCPSNFRAHSDYGTELIATDLDAAVIEIDRAIELNPRYAKAYSNRGTADVKKGLYDAAIGDFNKAIELNPGFAAAYNNRGTVYSKKGLYDTAVKDFNKAIELNPGLAEAYSNRSAALNRQGLYDAVIQGSRNALDLSPDLPEAFVNRSVADLGKGLYREAIQECDKAIALNARYAPAYSSRAIAYYVLKAYDKAWADVRTCRKLGEPPHPGFVRALSNASGRSE
jgi:tetratricopeptide (TPR) repeat protein